MSHRHHGQEPDWATLGPELEREAELHLPYLEQAARWLVDLLGPGDRGAPAVRRVLDVGSGPGVVSTLLAETFPTAEVVAVDQAPELLRRVRERAAARGLADRVVTHRADLPGAFDALPAADLVWTSKVVHHFGDQQAAVDALARRLRPGGLLAVAEGGLPLRYLPRDAGVGRPGLQARLDAVWEEGFAEMRAELPGTTRVVEDWPAMLAAAGLVPSGSRTFLTEHQAPLGKAAREHLHSRLSRLRDRLGDRLAPDDRAALDELLDPQAATGVLARPDAFLLQATTVHTARLTP